MTNAKEAKKVNKRPKLHIAIITLLVVIALAAVGSGIYFYQQYLKSQELLKNPTLSAKLQQESLVDKVGKLIELPTEEQPTIATVSDVNKLKNQPFFAHAKNGYKVLIYTKAKKAVLYNPQSNRIVEVGPINLGQTPTPAPAAAAARVAIYNGTGVTNAAAALEKQVKEKFSNITVVEKATANKSDYLQTLVIDLTGKQKEALLQLTKFVNGQTADLPKEEAKPANVDILIIIGKQ